MLKTKFLKLLATVAIVTSMAVPVMAAESTEVNQYKLATTGESKVKYSLASTFTVSIPKTITLDTDHKTSTYTVKVKGDIYGNQKVTVIPTATFSLNDANGKRAVDATVKQDKKEFSVSEIAGDGISTTGTITANGLSAGEWSGALNFTIATPNTK